MSHWDYIKVGGVWPSLSLLTSSIMAEIDRRLFKSLNADDGGTWAPTSQIIIGGQGLRVNGPFLATDAYVVISPGKVIQVRSGGSANFDSGSTFNLAGTTAMTGTFTVSSPGQIRISNINGLHVLSTGSMLVDGYVTIAAGASLDVNGQLLVNASAAAQFDGTSTFTGTTSFTGYVNFSTASGKVVRFYGHTDFLGDSYTMVEGTSGHVATWGFGRDSLVLIGGSSGHNSVWQIGQYTTVDDSGAWTRRGTETWASGGDVLWQSGSTLSTLAGSMANFGGGILLTMAQPNKNQDPGADNILTSTQVAKAWGAVHTNGLGGVLLDDGLNVASVSLSSDETVTITFARAMANNTYSVLLSPRDGGGRYAHAQVTTKHENFFVIGFYASTASSAPDVDIAHDSRAFDFSVMARQ